jgi:glycosyltransferase involved in cell wall biosynthesis
MMDLKILIVADHASARFGGEAVLPIHYFRELRARGLPVWLLTHARTREELVRLFPAEDRIVYIEDTRFHIAMCRIGEHLPDQVAYLTTSFLSRVSTQIAQRGVARRMIQEHDIDVIHQPIPVSPREPSLLFGLGAPVVIGPMNGGMEYPPAFRQRRGIFEQALVWFGRASARVLNVLMPGKRRAAMLLVANDRTRAALAVPTRGRVAELVENGVDLSLWKPREGESMTSDIVTFVFMGRLIAWKSVELLLKAFAAARKRAPMRLWILGDGDERVRLEQLARELSLPEDVAKDSAAGTVQFAGWLSQPDCKARLNAADCLVLPSLFECGGAVVLEAMALGKPVIATAWGGPLDYLDAECGILVQPVSLDGLVDGLAAAMLEMASSPEKRRRMGACAMAKIRSHYSWSGKVGQMIEFYDAARRSGAPSERKGAVHRG